MDLVLRLDEMSVAEKMAAMERLWENICSQAEQVPSPAWHEELLAARAQRLREGKTGFSEIREVRERLRNARQ